MEQEATYFWENGIVKSAFQKNKKPININEVEIERIKWSDKKSHGKDSFKYFIGYGHEVHGFSVFIIRKTSSNECIYKMFW